MKNKFLYSILVLYACTQSPKVDIYTPSLEDICPKIKNVRVELKKEFDGDVEGFRKTYIINTDNQSIEFKIKSEEDEKYIKFSPLKKEIEIDGFPGERTIYKDLKFSEKNKDYENKLNEFIDSIRSFDNSKWIYFNLEDVIECVEKNGFSK
tara:strand:+ start:173 stop:625 length:453 start_codon:yes stop_codon:yes gene_type:complete